MAEHALAIVVPVEAGASVLVLEALVDSEVEVPVLVLLPIVLLSDVLEDVSETMMVVVTVTTPADCTAAVATPDTTTVLVAVTVTGASM